MGSFLAIHDGVYNWWIIALSILTTLLLQILSNLANDYGDSQKGTDNINRLGPDRAVQSGEISAKDMKKGIFLFVMLSLLSGLSLLYISFPNDFLKAGAFLILGVGAILSAIKYTIGKGAYGYSGFGDLFVFLFFGLAGVIGTYYLNTKQIEWDILLPAIVLGFLSMGVLNLNNMRDIDNDILSGKHTLASRLGLKKAKIYHMVLILGAFMLSIIFIVLNYSSVFNFLFVIAIIPMLNDLIGISKQDEQALLDPYLKRLALGTFVFTLLFGFGMLL